MKKYFHAVLLVVVLAGCGREAMRQFGEALIADRSPVTFVENGVRPIFDCAKSPDPRYPCQGMGPEGFVRDLVVKPFANKKSITVVDHDRKQVSRISWTWFSMQGACGGGAVLNFEISGRRIFARPVRTGDSGEIGLSRLSAQYEHEKTPIKNRYPGGPIWPPQSLCDADGIDLSAGHPFSAALWLYVPDPTDKSFNERLGGKAKPKHSDFKVGCREEQRNGLTWSVCLQAGQERPGGPNGSRETQIENWEARLGDSGFVIEVTGWYVEPLYLWPQWYAERQAALLEVIDSVRYEKLPPTLLEK